MVKILIEKIKFLDKEISLWQDDIVIIVWPNSSWKSQFLKDIVSLSKKTTSKILSKIHFMHQWELNDFENFIQNSFKLTNSNYIWINWSIASGYINLWWNSDYYHLFGDLFISRLDTEKRLSIANSPNSISRKDQPTHIFHELFLKQEKLNDLNNYLYKTFKKYLIVDEKWWSKTSLYTYKETKDNTLSHADYSERIDEVVTIDWTLTDEEWDGIKSYIWVVWSCISTNKSILCIDEPESFLHPPQAEILGKTISEITTWKQLFIATHSADFVKWLLDSNSTRIKILRIVRNDAAPIITILDNDAIREFLSDPLLRYSNILNSLFNHKVVICESDGDCMFFKAVFDELQKKYPEIDFWSVLFVHTSTKDRMHVVAKRLRELWIDVRIVADVDIINNWSRTFCLSLESLWSVLTPIEINFQKINNLYIQKKKKKTFFKDLKKNWIQVSGKNSRMIKLNLNEIIAYCDQNRLFIVPQWELESFYPDIKLHWPDRVLKVLLNKDISQNQQLLTFVKKVVS